jgi:hypothetical protein
LTGVDELECCAVNGLCGCLRLGPKADQNRGFHLGSIVTMMPANLQRWRANGFATNGEFSLQIFPFLRQCLIRPNVDMLHVPLQLERKRLKLIGNRNLLWISEFNSHEHSSIRQVYPMVDACCGKLTDETAKWFRFSCIGNRQLNLIEPFAWLVRLLSFHDLVQF